MPVQVPMIVMNSTANNLLVTGSYGGDLSYVVPKNTSIAPGTGLIVAYFNAPDAGTASDNWDFVYLGDEANNNAAYQIYIEFNAFVGFPPDLSAYFGWSTAPSTPHGGSNPKPFPIGFAQAVFTYSQSGNFCSIPVYILQQTPPNG